MREVATTPFGVIFRGTEYPTNFLIDAKYADDRVELHDGQLIGRTAEVDYRIAPAFLYWLVEQGVGTIHAFGKKQSFGSRG